MCYLIALSVYWHVTFHGYNALPFLQRTVIFVYPIAALIVVFFVALASGTNLSIAMADARLSIVNV